MPRINKTFYPRGKSEKSKPGIFPPDAKQQTVARCSLTNKQSAAAVRNSIVKKARAKAQGKRLYIRGVINQDPSTEASPVELFEQANKEEADFDVLLPAEIDEATGFLRER